MQFLALYPARPPRTGWFMALIPGMAMTPLIIEAALNGKFPRPALPVVIPSIEALVGGKQRLQGTLALQREILAVRQRRVLLPLDVAAVTAREAVIFALANLVEHLPEVAHDVDLSNRIAACAAL